MPSALGSDYPMPNVPQNVKIIERGFGWLADGVHEFKGNYALGFGGVVYLAGLHKDSPKSDLSNPSKVVDIVSTATLRRSMRRGS